MVNFHQVYSCISPSKILMKFTETNNFSSVSRRLYGMEEVTMENDQDSCFFRLPLARCVVPTLKKGDFSVSSEDRRSWRCSVTRFKLNRRLIGIKHKAMNHQARSGRCEGSSISGNTALNNFQTSSRKDALQRWFSLPRKLSGKALMIQSSASLNTAVIWYSSAKGMTAAKLPSKPERKE